MSDETKVETNDAPALKSLPSTKKRKKAKFEEGANSLQITSMMDMMTIILTFLLKSVGQEPIPINQNDDLRLTYSTSEITPEDMLILSITRTTVMVEDEGVVPIQDGRIDEQALQSESSDIVPRIQQEVEERLAQQEEWSRQLGRTYERTATIVSDGRAPYRIITQVMMSASAGGVENFKFAILQREQGTARGSSL
jgi:biopolymer transport protein ExbD